METINSKDWLQMGLDLFGEDKQKWKFKCVQCGNVQMAIDFINAGIEEKEAKGAGRICPDWFSTCHRICKGVS